MQVHVVQRPHSGRTQSGLRRSHEDSPPEEDETHGQKETRVIRVQSHLKTTKMISFIYHQSNHVIDIY